MALSFKALLPLLLLSTASGAWADTTGSSDKDTTAGKHYTLGVYVLCDEALTKALQGRDVKEYIGAFFNTINLIFRRMPDPQVRFDVVELEDTSNMDTLKKAYAAARLSSNQYLYGLWPEHFNITKDGYMDGPSTANKLVQYFTKTGEPYNNSHIIVLFTARTLLRRRYPHDWKNATDKNYLFVDAHPKHGGICTEENLVITYDNGHFSGLTYTARKLARLLGANYDYEKVKDCLYRTDMLMGDIDKDSNSNYIMSPCTQKDLAESLGNATKEGCLKRSFKSQVTSTQKLPANIFNTDQYCAHVFPGKLNIAECTQEKWSLSLYPYAGTCEVRCCYGVIDSWKRNLFSMHIIPSLDGYPCSTEDVKSGICVKNVCEVK